MLTCIRCSKQLRGRSLEEKDEVEELGEKRVVKTLTAQIKEMAVKASGAYQNCKPCLRSADHERDRYSDSEEASSEKIHWSYRRAGGDDSTAKMWGKQMKGVLSEDRTPASCGSESMIFTGEDDSKEWVAHVEPGVLITFSTLPEGGNELKKFRFSRDMFNKQQAQRWWTENYDKVIELYNVQRFNRQTVPVQSPQTSEYEVSSVPSVRGAPVTPPLSNERLLRSMHRSKEAEDSSAGSLDHQDIHPSQPYDPSCFSSTPKDSNISGARTETSSVDESERSSSSYETDRSRHLSVSNASDLETEWVERDEPGVYITIRELPSGIRELRRVRFSRDKFREIHARLWWEENRARIQEQYL